MRFSSSLPSIIVSFKNLTTLLRCSSHSAVEHLLRETTSFVLLSYHKCWNKNYIIRTSCSFDSLGASEGVSSIVVASCSSFSHISSFQTIFLLPTIHQLALRVLLH